MKKITVLLLALPLFSYSQVNFGVRVSSVTIDNIAKAPEKASYTTNAGKYEALGLENTIGYSAFIEFKKNNIAGELDFMYYKTEGNVSFNAYGASVSGSYDVETIMPTLSFKYYPANSFAVKAGIYTNPANVKSVGKASGYTFNQDFQLQNTGLSFGFEVYVFKGLLLDARLLSDLDGSDDIRTRHLIFSIGYKI